MVVASIISTAILKLTSMCQTRVWLFRLVIE